MILTPLQKLPNRNAGDLGKIIAAIGFESLPKVQKDLPIWPHCLHSTWSEKNYCNYNF